MTVDSSPLYEDIFEVVPHPIMVHDAETGVVCRANPAACELVGIDRERLEGSAVGAFSPPGFTTADALAKIREAAETGHAAVEWVVADSDGTHRSVEVELRSADIADACRVIACINDVTEYRELDRRERTRDEQLRTLVENLPVVVFTFDPDGVFTYADGTALGSLGLEGDELEGTSVFEAYEQCPDIVDAARRATDGEEVRVTQEVEEVVFETWYQPVFDEGGDLSQVVGVARDVTDRRRREERVERLSDATNELLYSRTEEAVAETVTTIARQIIGRPLAAVWSYDEQADTLLPIGSTIAAAEFAGVDVAADLPPMEGDCAEKRIFDAGDPVVIEDYQAVENVSAPGVPLGTLLCVPLDDFGLLCVGSTEVAPFSETERFLLDILAGTATAALDRVAREASMRRQRETLQRRTDQIGRAHV